MFSIGLALMSVRLFFPILDISNLPSLRADAFVPDFSESFGISEKPWRDFAPQPAHLAPLPGTPRSPDTPVEHRCKIETNAKEETDTASVGACRACSQATCFEAGLHRCETEELRCNPTGSRPHGRSTL